MTLKKFIRCVMPAAPVRVVALEWLYLGISLVACLEYVRNRHIDSNWATIANWVNSMAQEAEN
ncbi:hypothetical protein BPOR_0379g00010 [Botrytis porri]|uniref:Uncharacterized protein n=1 Tax=Botrytis porri TaxID=87229 RepID=A0A4Z1KJV7_9HELO|nr:hypothetical protein BPOR_0379g00010 [Botrytis porri]